MRHLIISFTSIIFTLILCRAAMCACDCGSVNSASPCTGQSISVTVIAGTPNGGTAVNNIYNWSFNSGGGDARCGQFANGDYWIAPASGQSTVTITGISSTSHPTLIAADVNPTTESMGLMTGVNGYGNYSSGENIIPTLPQSYTGITSVLAGIQRNEAGEGGCGTPSITGECIDSYNVVTVLSSVPENSGSTVIRPNITGENKELLTWSDFDLSRIPSKSFLVGTDQSGLDAIRRRWAHSTEIFGLSNSAGTLLTFCSEGGRAFRSHALIDDYGGGVAQRWGDDLMILSSDDHTLDNKKPALASMLSYGLDLYHAVHDAPVGVTRKWGTGATQHPGKFLPPVMFAALLIDTSKSNILKGTVQHIHESHNGPLEMAQIRDGNNGPVWGDEKSTTGVNYQGTYWGSLMSSQCYDNAPEMETWDYYTFGQWKSFSIPVGSLHSGSGLRLVLWSKPNGSTGDLKVRNVALDGVPINFNSITLSNYYDGTSSGTIEDSGSTYSTASGTTIKKISTETYTVSSGSILTFEWYQSAQGISHGIGFEDNTTYDDTDRIVQISGSWSETYMYQKGCNPAIGGKNFRDPYQLIDGPPNKPGTSYMISSFGVQKAFVAAMYLIPKICDTVNYDLIVEYVDRLVNHGIQAGGDQCVTPDNREDFTNCDPYRNRDCLYYGVTWGPVTPTDINSECITTPTEGHTKQGRFTDLDGTPLSPSYPSSQVESNWAAIRGTGSCRSSALRRVRAPGGGIIRQPDN